MVKNLTIMQETPIWSLGQENPLEKGMVTHSSILTWRIPCTEESTRLQRRDMTERLTLSLSFFLFYHNGNLVLDKDWKHGPPGVTRQPLIKAMNVFQRWMPSISLDQERKMRWSLKNNSIISKGKFGSVLKAVELSSWQGLGSAVRLLGSRSEFRIY